MNFSKYFLAMLGYCTSISCLLAQPPDPRIGALIGSVRSDSLAATLQDLTGAKDVLVDGNSATIGSRALGAPGRISALQNLTQRFKDYGYTVVQQPIMRYFAGTNIVAEQPGTEFPTQKFILCAHYDDRPLAFNTLGEKVATLVSEHLPPGTYSRQWNASGCSSGLYFYRLQAGSFTETKRLVLTK